MISKAIGFFGLGIVGLVAWALVARGAPGPYAPTGCDEACVRRVVDETVPRARALASNGPELRLEWCAEERAGWSFSCEILADGEWRWVRAGVPR